MRHKLVLGLIMVAALGATATAYFALRGGPADPQITAVAITRGSILKTVQATGTLQAVSTVEVGSQVSGRISELHADFNSVVHKGQIIARLDPSLFQAQVDQARATLARVEAQQNGALVQQKDAQNKLTRAKELAKSNLIAAQDLEAAQTTYDAAVAAVTSARADAVQARAQLNQAQLNLEHTIIQAPTDGVVISRSVEVGQTVAAAMQAPTLFTIAGDLSLMQVNASIDEADIGSIRPKQPVSFTVDAYPERTFRGQVSQVRLQPTVVQNVTTYITVIDVPNKDLLLKPGMTATVTVKVAEREDVLRVPNAALRFRPTPEVLAALGSPAATAAQPRRASADRATGPSSAGDDAEPASDWRHAATIDAAFGPVPTPNSRARLWQIRDGHLVPVAVRLGLTDGTTTELIEGPLEAGSSVVTNVALPASTSAASQSRSPLLPQFPRQGTRGAGRTR